MSSTTLKTQQVDEKQNILLDVTDVMRTVFKQPSLVVERSTTASNVKGWDSLNHVALIIAIEAFYKIRFRASEIAKLQNVGELVDLIDRRLVKP